MPAHQGRRDSVSWSQVIVLAQPAGARPNTFVPAPARRSGGCAQVVQCPLVQHIDQPDFTSGLVQCHSTPSFIFERA
jgi:hypothetical protein